MKLRQTYRRLPIRWDSIRIWPPVKATLKASSLAWELSELLPGAVAQVKKSSASFDKKLGPALPEPPD